MQALLDQKYDKLFGLLDANGNGAITHHDFDRMTDHVLAAFEAERTEGRGKSFAEEMTNYWNALREVADIDDDGEISRAEFRQALHQVTHNFDALVAPLYRACFLLADSDDDGVVSKREFIAAEVAVGVPEDEAGETFDRLTEDGEQLTMDRVVTAVAQFYRDDSANEESRLFFGSL